MCQWGRRCGGGSQAETGPGGVICTLFGSGCAGWLGWKWTLAALYSVLPSASNLWHFMHSPHDCKKEEEEEEESQSGGSSKWLQVDSTFWCHFSNLSPAERALKSKYVWKLPAGSLVISSVNIPTQLDGVSLGKARFINVPGAASQGQQTSRPKEHSSPLHHSVSEHAPGVRWET